MNIDQTKLKNWPSTLILMSCATVLWFVLEAIFATLKHYSIVQVVWTRYGIHLICMLLLLGPRRTLRHTKTQKATLQISRGALMISMPLLGIVAISKMRFAEFMAAFWLLPVFVVGIVQFCSYHRVHFRSWAVVILAYVGILVVYRPRLELYNANIIFALGSAFSFSLYFVLTHRLQKVQNIYTNLLYTAMVVVCPSTLVLPYFWQMPSLVDAIKMSIIGVLGLAALWCFEKVLEFHKPVGLAPMLFLFPLWGMLGTLFFSGFTPTPSIIIGLVMIIASLIAHLFMEVKSPIKY